MNKNHLFLFLVFLVKSATANLVIDSLITTPSVCANDGSIKIFARSSSTLIYSIISGPSLRPAQSNNQFSALPQGLYQILITNFSNDTVYSNVTVGGVYQFPDFAPTFTKPICVGSATGTIVGTPNINAGKPPFTWVLTNTITNVAITQTSDTFRNLPAADYSLRLYDSCQSFATRFVHLEDPTDTFTFAGLFNNFIACDTDELSLTIYSPNSNFVTPYTLTVTTPNHTYSKTYFQPQIINNNCTFVDTIPNLNYGQSTTITIVDGCGRTVTVPNDIPNWDFDLYFNQKKDSCLLGYYATFSVFNIYSTSRFNPYGNLYVEVWDSTAGQKIDSVVLPQFIYSTSGILIPNHLYFAKFSDECGNLVSKYFTGPVIDTPRVEIFIQPISCLDSTASLMIRSYNFTSTPVLTILSGPTIAQSTKPYFSYKDSIFYPFVYSSLGSYCGSSANFICYQIGGLSKGTYQYQVADTCGHIITGSFIVTAQDVASFTYQKAIIKGCPGQNKLHFDLFLPNEFLPGFTKIKPLNATAYMDSSNAYILTIDSTNPASFLYKYSGNYTFANLNAGTYVLSNFMVDDYFPYSPSPLISPSMNCLEFTDTIIIPPYQNPKINYSTQIQCNGTINIVFKPDSNTGVAPYYYEIINGPQSRPLQSSPVFQLTQQGSYIARISDTCGFARTFSFFVDTISFPQIVKTGASCVGNATTLIAEHSSYATYIWKRPDGTFYMGDSLHINPVVASSYGVYVIQKIVHINNCIDTFFSNYTLTSNQLNSISHSICNGHSYLFDGRLLTQSGIYFDTISTSGCDSVIQLNLSVNPFIHDSISKTICAGKSIIVGTKTYSTSGIYRDTFSMANCDSIRVLNLTVSGYLHDSISKTICAGKSIIVGTKTYTTSGIYRDTFSMANCDSIRVLNLTVSGYLRDSISKTICAGKSLIVGTKTYTTSGIYRDTFSMVNCDSIRVLNLTVSGYLHDSISKTICAGKSLIIGTKTYSTSGIYRDTFSMVNCDSIRVLNLTVSGYLHDSISKTICAGKSLIVGTKTYANSGIYRDTFIMANCDSIRVLNLTVSGYLHDSISKTICAGKLIIVGTKTYSTSGIYRDTFSMANCDSIRVLNLTVRGYLHDSISKTICAGKSIIVGTKTYTTSGIYRDTFSMANCDSIRVLNLMVNGYLHDSISKTICAGKSLVVGTKTYTNSGIYRDTFSMVNCDSIRVLNLTVVPQQIDSVDISFCEGKQVVYHGHSYNQAGIFIDTIHAGFCDSILVINVKTFPTPTIQINVAETIVPEGDTIQLAVLKNPSFQYFWSSTPPIPISNPTSYQITAQIITPTWVIASVKNEFNCTASDSVFIQVKKCEPKLYIPNAFSPNGDEINDEWLIYGNCVIFNRVKIFDRWGEKVWDSPDMNIGWNGYYKGVLQPAGVYVYVLNYGFENTPYNKEMKGSITLIR